MSVFEGVLLPLRMLHVKCSSYHIQILVTQDYAFCNFKYRFDKWRWRKHTFWRDTVMHWCIILKIVPNALSRVCMTFIDIHRKVLSNGRCLKSSNCNSLKTVSRNLIFVNAISIVFEIVGITVKIVCKMTFDDNYSFWRILKSYFLRKTQQSLFSACFFVPRYAWMNTKLTTS